MAPIAPPQTFQTILTLVQALESAYPNDSWINTAARIRKSYYTGFFWTLLTLKSITLTSPSTQHGLSQKTVTTLTKGQLIFQDAQGNSVDFRHACTAIESLASPRFNWFLRRISGLSIPAVLSWSGDVGSVLTEYALTRGKNGNLQNYYNQYANPCDLFGDIDGYALYVWGKTCNIENRVIASATCSRSIMTISSLSVLNFLLELPTSKLCQGIVIAN